MERRLTALEQAPGASREVWRVFGTNAEADADTEPPPPGAMVLRIVTGVSRPPDASRAHRTRTYERRGADA
jgi:hypothetical protein